MTKKKFFIKHIKRTVSNILFLHVFNQTEEELKGTTNAIFNFSLILLFASIIITIVLIFASTLPVSKEIKSIFQSLDGYGFCAFFSLILAALLTTEVETDGFRNRKPTLIWVSYFLVLIGVVMISIIFVTLVFGKHGLTKI